MASKAKLAVIILLISLISKPDLAESSSFDFLGQIQGCHKGDTMKGIGHLKSYLHQFGYLPYQNESLANLDHFDDSLESAIKTYQLNYHLNVSGTLDSKTVSTMAMPRCGVADIVNGTTRMESGKSNHRRAGTRANFHTVSHYSFFPGNPKWGPSKYHLTYGFLPETPDQAKGPVARAFNTWAANTHFTFERAQDYMAADVRIGFHRGRHGDGAPFDGKGGVVAHAFAPEDGRFHYDGDEKWSVGAVAGAFDLETVALHEIGHVLGLGHSSVEAAIMFSAIAPGSTKGLHPDDVQGIRALYNM